jgi:uncharacterized protein YcfJ
MQSKILKAVFCAGVISILLGISACASYNPYRDPYSNTKIGAATGAVTGAAIGYGLDKKDGAAVGAAAGAVLGGAIGHQTDRQRYYQNQQPEYYPRGYRENSSYDNYNRPYSDSNYSNRSYSGYR